MIEINNLIRIKIDERFLRKIAKKILEKEKKRLDVSIALVDQKRIKKLNKEYRKKDKATDILSFLYDGSGELIICPKVVKENAEKFGTAFEKELGRVVIHGILHLLGEKHEKGGKKEKRMTKKEEYYIRLIS